MSTRADYRTALINKLRDAANNLGNTFFSTTEYNDILANAPRRIFPYVYRLQEVTAVAPDDMGRIDCTATTPAIDASTVTRVYLDADDSIVWGWMPRGTTKITGLDSQPLTSTGQSQGTYSLQYMTPHTMPGDDVTAVTIPDQYFDFTVLAAAIDALERMSSDKINYRGFRPSGETGVDENEILNALDTLKNEFKDMVDQKAMGMPGIGG